MLFSLTLFSGFFNAQLFSMQEEPSIQEVMREKEKEYFLRKYEHDCNVLLREVYRMKRFDEYTCFQEERAASQEIFNLIMRAKNVLSDSEFREFINVADSCGYTPIHLAVLKGLWSVVVDLLTYSDSKMKERCRKIAEEQMKSNERNQRFLKRYREVRNLFEYQNNKKETKYLADYSDGLDAERRPKEKYKRD
jgi:hypothetical protein